MVHTDFSLLPNFRRVIDPSKAGLQNLEPGYLYLLGEGRTSRRVTLQGGPPRRAE